MRPLMAHCHHGLGTLYATTGQREQARTSVVDSDRDVQIDGHDLLVTSDRSGAGTGGLVMLMRSAIRPPRITLRPRASHNPSHHSPVLHFPQHGPVRTNVS